MTSKTKIIISIIFSLTLLFIPTAFAFNQKEAADEKTTEETLRVEQEKKFAAIRNIDETLETPKGLSQIENVKPTSTPSPQAIAEGTPKQILPSKPSPTTPPQATVQPKVAARQPSSTSSTQYTNYDITYIKKRICEVFGPQCANANKIVQSESNYRLNVVSPTNDYGLFQINCKYHAQKVGGDCTRYFDLETNLRIAKQIFDASGWNPWSTCKIHNICQVR